jgi:hypothetical protein
MDISFRHAGNEPMFKFEREVASIALIFGGKYSDEFKEASLTTPYESSFGFYPCNTSYDYISFPASTPEPVCRFFNMPYGCFDEKDTSIIRNFVLAKGDDVRKISPKIYEELSSLTDDEWWDIS